MLEVIRYDSSTDTFYVCSGFGRKSDWFLNIKKTPEVTVVTGKRRFKAVAKQLPDEEAEREILDYSRRHPSAIRNLARIAGYGDVDVKKLAGILPVVGITPVDEG